MPLCHFFLSLTKQLFKFSAYFLCELMSGTFGFILPCVNQIDIKLMGNPWTLFLSVIVSCFLHPEFLQYVKYEADMQHTVGFGITWSRNCGVTDTEFSLLDLKVSITCHALLLFICLSLCHIIHIHTKEIPKKASFIFSSVFLKHD